MIYKNFSFSLGMLFYTGKRSVVYSSKSGCNELKCLDMNTPMVLLDTNMNVYVNSGCEDRKEAFVLTPFGHGWVDITNICADLRYGPFCVSLEET